MKTSRYFQFAAGLVVLFGLCSGTVRAEFEELSSAEKIVDAFERNDCVAINAEFQKQASPKFSPTISAVIASCLPDQKQAIQLFQEAARLKPNSQVILILYAKRLGKTDIEGAKGVWRRIRLVARDQPIRRMAEDFLSGVVDIEEEEQISLGHTYSGYIYLQYGAGYYSNPGVVDISNTTTDSDSYGQSFALTSQFQRNTEWGNWGARLGVAESNFFHTHDANTTTFRLDSPVSIAAGNNGNLVFTPYAAQELAHHSPFQSAYGLGVMGLYYGQSFRQSVQAVIFRDFYYDQALSGQEGNHFRFEYEWLFYPSWYEMSFGTFIEHVHSALDIDTANSATLAYSHNDIGLYFTALARLRYLEFSLYVNGSTRQDTNDSSYYVNNFPVIKRRSDYAIELRPAIGIPLERSTKLSLYFDYSRNFSNMGASDYQDYNTVSRIAGVNLDFQLEWL